MKCKKSRLGAQNPMTLLSYSLTVVSYGYALLMHTNCLYLYINEYVGANSSIHAVSRKKSGCFYTRIFSIYL